MDKPLTPAEAKLATHDEGVKRLRAFIKVLSLLPIDRSLNSDCINPGDQCARQGSLVEQPLELHRSAAAPAEHSRPAWRTVEHPGARAHQTFDDRS